MIKELQKLRRRYSTEFFALSKTKRDIQRLVKIIEIQNAALIKIIHKHSKYYCGSGVITQAWEAQKKVNTLLKRMDKGFNHALLCLQWYSLQPFRSLF